MNPSIRRTRSRCLPALLASVFLLAGGARAVESVPALIQSLKSDPDFRVRTQAALALGASKDATAVEPLCAGLEDTSTTVRAAAAAALGRLGHGGKTCLEERLAEETNVSVKSVIAKAITQVDAGGVHGGGVTATTVFYVAVGDTSDKSGRTDTSVNGLVRGGMLGAAGEAGSQYAVAPEKETLTEAKNVMKQFKHLRGFFLWPKVSPPEYAAGNLTIRFELSIFTYPGKSLKAVLPMKLTMPDVPSTDRSSEDELIKMAASKAFEKFTASAASIQ